VINGDDSIHSLLQPYDHVIFNWLEDVERSKSLISTSDVVVVDSYLAGLEFYELVTSLALIKVFVDDNKRLDFPDGIVLNGSIYAEELGYSQNGKYSNLLGARYFLLRKPFQAVESKIIKKKVKTILITFGATDLRDLTTKTELLLKQRYKKFKKYIVIGPGFPKSYIVERHTNIEYFSNLDATGMKSLMLDADIAISACGTTLYELACVGVPTIGVIVADNQSLNAEKFADIQFLSLAGQWDDPDLLVKITELIDKLADNKLRTRASFAGQEAVKGDGAIEVASFLRSTYYQEKLVFSPAIEENCDLYYEWANEEEVRKNSFNTDKIPYETHVKWFFNKLRSEQSHLFVGYIESLPVGQIRIDVEDKVGIISYSIAKEWRGKGLGTLFLQEIPSILEKDGIQVEILSGSVQPQNIASQKAFEKAGFQKREKEGILEYELKYEHFSSQT